MLFIKFPCSLLSFHAFYYFRTRIIFSIHAIFCTRIISMHDIYKVCIVFCYVCMFFTSIKFACALLSKHALYKFVCALLSFHALYLVYTRTILSMHAIYKVFICSVKFVCSL